MAVNGGCDEDAVLMATLVITAANHLPLRLLARIDCIARTAERERRRESKRPGRVRVFDRLGKWPCLSLASVQQKKEFLCDGHDWAL